jgi:toxin YoeB
VRLLWTEEAWEDYLHWQKNDPKVVQRINDLIKDITRDPFKGLGKPEPLKHALSGWWSRRITGEHRITVLRGRRPPRFWKLHNAAIIIELRP